MVGGEERRLQARCDGNKVRQLFPSQAKILRPVCIGPFPGYSTPSRPLRPACEGISILKSHPQHTAADLNRPRHRRRNMALSCRVFCVHARDEAAQGVRRRGGGESSGFGEDGSRGGRWIGFEGERMFRQSAFFTRSGDCRCKGREVGERLGWRGEAAARSSSSKGRAG